MNPNTSRYHFEQTQARQAAESIHVAAVVRVVSFDPKAMTVNVQPISKRLTQGEYATPPQILQVPVSMTRGGGYLIRPWYKPGDIGVVVYLDHDMDEALKTADECKPNTERCHSDTDAVFVGGIVAGGWKAPELPEGVVLAAEDGSIYLAVTKENVQVLGDIVVKGDVIADGISLKKHKHTEVTAGGDLSGPPK